MVPFESRVGDSYFLRTVVYAFSPNSGRQRPQNGQ